MDLRRKGKVSVFILSGVVWRGVSKLVDLQGRGARLRACVIAIAGVR